MAEEFAAHGYQVLASVRDRNKAAHFLGTTSSPSFSIDVIDLDVTSTESIPQAAEDIRRRYLPDGKLDVLVNNAGLGYTGPLIESDLATARQLYDVNVIGLLAVTRAFAPMLIAAKGKLVNISSIGGLLAMPWTGKQEDFNSYGSKPVVLPFLYPRQYSILEFMKIQRRRILSRAKVNSEEDITNAKPEFVHGLGLYHSSKAAVTILSETLRLELAPLGVTVITGMLGSIRTNFHSNDH